MAFTTARCTLKPNEGRLVEQAWRQLPVGVMADLLYDYELLLLIQISPLGGMEIQMRRTAHSDILWVEA